MLTEVGLFYREQISSSIFFSVCSFSDVNLQYSGMTYNRNFHTSSLLPYPYFHECTWPSIMVFPNSLLTVGNSCVTQSPDYRVISDSSSFAMNCPLQCSAVHLGFQICHL